VAFAALLGAAIVLAGVVGAISVLVLGVGSALLNRRYGSELTSRVSVCAAGGFALLGAALLSLGPWRSADGYVGGSYAVQLASLIGIVALAVSAMRKP
jgi:arabinofuranan 3-O-arabinosyltransferase